MRIHKLIAATGLIVFAAVAHAQDTTKQPSELSKVAHKVSKTSKAVGRDVKEDAKSVGSATHHALKTTGNAIKDESKEKTGYTSPKYDSTHKPGGVNKVARDISSTGKKAGATVKNTVKKTGSATHGELKEAGNATKDTLKKIKPPTI
jgi:hypothetical protein